MHEADRRVVRVLGVEAGVIEHFICPSPPQEHEQRSVRIWFGLGQACECGKEGHSRSSSAPRYLILVVSEKVCMKYASEAAAAIASRHPSASDSIDAAAGHIVAQQRGWEGKALTVEMRGVVREQGLHQAAKA